MLSTNSGYNMLNRYQWKCKIAFRDIFNSVFKVCKWGMYGRVCVARARHRYMIPLDVKVGVTGWWTESNQLPHLTILWYHDTSNSEHEVEMYLER